MQYRLWSSGKTVDLSREKKLGEGGEAQVFAIAALGLAAKIYHTPRQEHIDKLIVMVKNPPDDPTAAQGHVSIAWPSDLLLHPDGGVSGYVMPMVRGMEPLVSFYVPKLRRQTRPLFDYHYLVTAALNVATAVRALHARNYVIGDVNESNILIAETALATVVDTDSFQVPDPAKRILYRCPVGKPEFTPPELFGEDFARVDRTPEHDRFGLAVLLFQLLMEGTHPFDGVYAGPGEPPPVEGRIAAGHFPHAAHARVPWRPKPIAPPFALLDPALQRLFVQCFTEGHAHPSKRPDAAAWRSALAAAAQTLRTCRANDQHRHWGHVACPWCERATRLRGADPFPSKAAVRQGQHLQRRATGAPTPSAAPVPTPAARPLPRSPAAAPVRTAPAPPAPFRAAPAPPVPHGINPKVAWAVGVAGVLALLVVIIALASSGSSSPKLEFLDTPEQGKNFRVQAGMNMVWIAPGSFQMGDSTGKGDSDEKPVHAVRLTTGYWLGESEVTQGQWKAVMGNNPSQFPGDSLPVENVSWNDAVEFCKKLTSSARAAGRLPAGVEYRLPTEAQWEYACRAATSGDYAGDLDAMAWQTSNSGNKTHEVKSKRPNAWGLYDMHGNVWEWCSDGYENYSTGSQTDPTGASNGAGRVLRGGSWRDPGRDCRSARRDWSAPELRIGALGFRLAAVPSSTGGAAAAAAVPVPAVEPAARDERRVAPLEAGTQAGEEREVEIANGVKMAMCWVPAGSFTMGSPASEAGRGSDEAQVPVKLSGFWLAKHECPQRVWSAVMGGNPSNFKGESLPVMNVSWNACQQFVGKLGRLGKGWRFDLPTEAQWEYACRAGTSGAYAGALDEMGWHDGNSGGTTHPVGGKKANAWGLMDMHGNVWEWCRDAYGKKLPGGTDPFIEIGALRVDRGGSWNGTGWYCRSAFRGRHSPGYRLIFLGFRLAAVPSGTGGATAALSEPPPAVPLAVGSERRALPLKARNQEAAVIKTSDGEMVVEFWPDKAPNTVANFIKLAKSGFYDGTAFHRIIKGFMIQGGDPLCKDPAKEAYWGTGTADQKIKAEFNDTKHDLGVISMARSANPDSGSCQFFICLGPTPQLDGKYTAFGKVIKGEDVLKKLGDTPVGPSAGGEPSKPKDRVSCESIKIVPADSIK